MKASDIVKKKGKKAGGKKMNLMDWIGQRRKGAKKPMKNDGDDDEEC